MVPVSCVSVASCFSTLFFRVRCCSPRRLSPVHKPSSRFFPPLEKHTNTHSLVFRPQTHVCAHTCSTSKPHYPYLMLWCHNSLSGSLAWQPFVTHCSWGGKRSRAALLVFFFPPPVGWNMFGAHAYILSKNTPSFIMMKPLHQQPPPIQLTRWRGVKKRCGTPSLPTPVSPEPHWEVKSLNDTLKWWQEDGKTVESKIPTYTRCDISRHLWEIDRLSGADISSLSFSNSLALCFSSHHLL